MSGREIQNLGESMRRTRDRRNDLPRRNGGEALRVHEKKIGRLKDVGNKRKPHFAETFRAQPILEITLMQFLCKFNIGTGNGNHFK